MVLISKSSSEFEMDMFLRWFKSLRGEKIIHIIGGGSCIRGIIHEIPLSMIKSLHKYNDLKIQDISEV